MTYNNITGILVAAGSAKRFGSSIPKQYLPLKSKNVLYYTMQAFEQNEHIKNYCVVISKQDEDYYTKTLKLGHFKKVLPFVIGGNERQISVFNALEFLQLYKPDHVLIHDAARPNISQDLLNRIIQALDKNSAIMPVLPIVDTLRHIDMQTVNRDEFMCIQTPQGFYYPNIFHAHKKYATSFVTDDIELIKKDNISIKTVLGDRGNLKITYPEDLYYIEQLMQKNTYPDIRTASGFDVHRYCEGNHIWLGGVKIDVPYGLLGHSDADVVLHSITDALLGCIGAGDIGTHFPPTDMQYKNAASSIFLKDAMFKVKEQGGIINFIDVTIIGEQPKISPYRELIKASIANLVEIDISRVSIKATTTEKLGFTGRKEGLASQAIATVIINA